MSKFTFYILQVLLALCTGCMALPPETVPLFPELERQQINAAADGEIFSLREERIAEAEAGEASKEYALSEISIPDSTDEDVIPVTGSGSAILPVNTVHKISATIPVPPEEIVSSSRQGWIPPGFEALNEPQLMEVDVWYGGYYLTSALARFTFDDLTFIQPDLLTGSIPNLATSIDEFEALLSQTFATNSALACRSAFETECGNLSTEDVGIIFDRANFRVSLFVGPRHLGVIESRTSRYLPDSSAEFATVMDNNLFFSGSSNTSLAFNLNNQTQFSIAENRLLLRSNLTNTDGFVFDTVGLQRNYRGKDFQLGLVRGNAAGFEFMNSQHFIGFSYGTSLNTRTDLKQSHGNEIFLFFASRSRVEVFRDNRLLYSGYYDVGNNQLDTSSLPDGSYEIEIRITDLAGNTDTVRRFYSKSARLAPTDQPLYFFQAGSSVLTGGNELLPQRLTQFARGGYTKRLTPSLGAGLGFSMTGESSMAEANLVKLGRNYELTSRLAYESDGSMGVSTDLRLKYRSINLDLSVRRVLKERRQQLLSTDLSQMGAGRNDYRANLNFNSPIGRFSFFYRHASRYSLPIRPAVSILDESSEDSPDFANTNYGMRWNYNGVNFANGQLRVNAEVSKNDGRMLALVGVTYNFRNRKSQYSLAPRVVGVEGEAGRRVSKLEGSSNAGWLMGNEDQHRVDLRAYKQGQSFVEANFQTTAFAAANEITMRQDIDNNVFSYNGRLGSTLATTGGERAFGNSMNGESAFLVNVSGEEDDDTEYEVLVDGSPRGITKAGETLLVPIAPFDTYKIELVAKGNSLVNLKENNFQRTVYPGNVIALDWAAISVKVAYGRILDSKGSPLVNAVITANGTMSVTDDQGYFQIEIGQDIESFSLRKGVDSCRVEFTQNRSSNLVVPLGDLLCDFGGSKSDEPSSSIFQDRQSELH